MVPVYFLTLALYKEGLGAVVSKAGIHIQYIFVSYVIFLSFFFLKIMVEDRKPGKQDQYAPSINLPK